MSYVALSRVKTLSGLHLVAFEDTSIRVSAGCIKEINRLRSYYHSNLPHIEVAVLENMPSAKLPAFQLLTAPNRFVFLCLKIPFHLHHRIQLVSARASE